MKTTPNCKINLGLRVLRRRADGYHDLASMFLPVPLYDELTIEACDATEEDCLFTSDGIVIDCAAKDNICVKAYRLMKADFPQLPSVRIHLHKHIPFGAGLGGGSSDAAFTLKMLNEMAGLGLTATRLKAYAARLGADCAFFIDNVPAYAIGIGDRLTPLGFNPLEGYRLVLAKPDEAVSTREAYAGLQLSSMGDESAYDKVESSPLCRALLQPMHTWRHTVVNDFETTVFPLHPAIARLKQLFYDHGAAYSAMSGSGATVFALFSEEKPLSPHLLEALGSQRLL